VRVDLRGLHPLGHHASCQSQGNFRHQWFTTSGGDGEAPGISQYRAANGEWVSELHVYGFASMFDEYYVGALCNGGEESGRSLLRYDASGPPAGSPIRQITSNLDPSQVCLSQMLELKLEGASNVSWQRDPNSSVSTDEPDQYGPDGSFRPDPPTYAWTVSY
jgi:hypothetical protein